MKLLLDAPISHKIATSLRGKGFDAVHLREIGKETADDDEIVRLAAHEGRIVVTADLDFAQILATGGLGGPSVIIFRLQKPVPSMVEKILINILKTYESELENGSVLSVTETVIRIRRLPLT